NKKENGCILFLNLCLICSKMKVLLHGDSPFEYWITLSFYRRSTSKGYFYAYSILSSTTGNYLYGIGMGTLVMNDRRSKTGKGASDGVVDGGDGNRLFCFVSPHAKTAFRP
ncbi:hypothetical protein P4532_07585, partial [Geobacillus stearothermophilus]|uniref:hypothetical protein n=1 Tax=Geobacillus stearothermophilus TaxID=1422 RepID=UPI002E23A6CC|nr:hypothetical protein [Geobacillus stearothermophilus]